MNRIGFLISLISRFSLCRLEQLKRTRIMGYFLCSVSFVGVYREILAFYLKKKWFLLPLLPTYTLQNYLNH